MVPYNPFLYYTTLTWRENHIFLYNIILPESLRTFLGTDSVVIGYSNDPDDMGGDIDVEGNILFSTISPHHYEGPPIPNNTYGLAIMKYLIENSKGPNPTGLPFKNSIPIDWKYLWFNTGHALFTDGPHPLDLIVDGDNAFVSAGDIDFNPREGLWWIGVQDTSDVDTAFIAYFERTVIGSDTVCGAKINGMDISGDYLFAVGTYSDDLLYQHRFWTIKVYKRNHSE